MGADLICYIAFGPDHIPINDSRATDVARQVRQYLDACITAAEQVLLGRKSVPDPGKAPVEARRSITLRLAVEEKPPVPSFASLKELQSYPEYRILVQDILTDCGREVEAAYAFTGTPEGLVKEVREFAAGWNGGCFRDMAFRIDPDRAGRKVVVAGELSWGDEPDGRGYRTLKKAFGLGIAQQLGVS